MQWAVHCWSVLFVFAPCSSVASCDAPHIESLITPVLVALSATAFVASPSMPAKTMAPIFIALIPWQHGGRAELARPSTAADEIDEHPVTFCREIAGYRERAAAASHWFQFVPQREGCRVSVLEQHECRLVRREQRAAADIQ